MHVEVEPGAILVLVGRAVEEHHLALVPALVGLADAGEVEAGGAVGRVGRHARHAALVALAAVRRVALVPDVDGDVLALRTVTYGITDCPCPARQELLQATRDSDPGYDSGTHTHTDQS